MPDDSLSIRSFVSTSPNRFSSFSYSSLERKTFLNSPYILVLSCLVLYCLVCRFLLTFMGFLLAITGFSGVPVARLL